MLTYNAEKLDLLRSQAERLNEAARGVSGRREDARLNLHSAEGDLARLLDPRYSGNEVYAPRVEEAEARVEKNRLEYERQNESYEVAQKAWLTASRLANSCVDFVERENAKPRSAGRRAASITPAPIVADPRPRLKQLRDRIAALEAERDQVESAPIPREESIARIDTMLAHHARDPEIALLTHPERGLFDYDSLSEFEFDHTVVWILRDQLRNGLIEWLDTYLNKQNLPFGLPAAARAKRIAELEQEILEVEYEEEQVICAHEGGEILLTRRLEADPRAVLEVEDDEVPQAAPPAPPQIVDPPPPRKIQGASSLKQRGLLVEQWTHPAVNE